MLITINSRSIKIEQIMDEADLETVRMVADEAESEYVMNIFSTEVTITSNLIPFSEKWDELVASKYR